MFMASRTLPSRLEALEPRLLLSAAEAVSASWLAPVGGAAAIERLGDDLSAVAQRHGISAETLRARLTNDPTLLVDAEGYLLYVEVPLPAEYWQAEAESADDAPQASEPISYGDTFLLHSRPGASKVIYLDFDGHYVPAGTAWNGGQPIDCGAFDTDGDPTTFSQAEMDKIIQVWLRVSEDYAPFDVDVTTEDPGEDALNRSNLGDPYYGIRVVFTPDNEWFGTAGGVAYDGSFAQVGSYRKPCFVFTDQTANSAKYMADAASHEVGHTLGLGHDGGPAGSYYQGHGTGATGWAPIMGTAYYKSLGQWSKGEYYGATNSQDDLHIIVTQNGFGYRPDDFGNTLATAAPLTLTNNIITEVQGLIERNTDVDVFSLSVAAGYLSMSIVPAAVGANLDILATLYDSAGQVVTVSNPANVLSAGFSLSLTAGTYYVAVEGTGWGSPLADPPTGYTDYGSLGHYWISGWLAPSQSPAIQTRQVFYNNSAWDGNDPAANQADDAAIDFGKQPLLPGETATAANFTGYRRGINGIMVDIEALPGVPTAADFAFTMGNTAEAGTWTTAPAPQSVTVRPGEGVGGSDRVTIIWADGAIANAWLGVEVLPTANTGLTESDVFYWGNLRGDFDASGDVGQADLDLVLLNWGSAAMPPQWVNGQPAASVGQAELDEVLLHWGSQLVTLAVPQAAEAVEVYALAEPAESVGGEPQAPAEAMPVILTTTDEQTETAISSPSDPFVDVLTASADYSRGLRKWRTSASPRARQGPAAMQEASARQWSPRRKLRSDTLSQTTLDLLAGPALPGSYRTLLS